MTIRPENDCGPVPQHSQKDPAGEVSQSELRVREAVLATDRLMDDVNELEAANARLRAINEQMLAVLKAVAREPLDVVLAKQVRAVIAKAEGRS